MEITSKPLKLDEIDRKVGFPAQSWMPAELLAAPPYDWRLCQASTVMLLVDGELQLGTLQMA